MLVSWPIDRLRLFVVLVAVAALAGPSLDAVAQQTDPAAMLLDQPIEGSVSLSRIGLCAHHSERCRFGPSCDSR